MSLLKGNTKYKMETLHMQFKNVQIDSYLSILSRVLPRGRRVIGSVAATGGVLQAFWLVDNKAIDTRENSSSCAPKISALHTFYTYILCQ